MIRKTISRKNNIIDLSYEIPNNQIGKSLKVSIDFENEVDQSENKLSNEDFVKWIKNAEQSPTMSLEQFNQKWEEKKLEILNNIR